MVVFDRVALVLYPPRTPMWALKASMWERPTSAIRVTGGSAATRNPANWRRVMSIAATDFGRRLTPSCCRYRRQVAASTGAALGDVFPVGFVAAVRQRLLARMRPVGLAAMEQHRVQRLNSGVAADFGNCPHRPCCAVMNSRTPYSISIRGDGGRGGRGDHGYLGEFGPHLGDLELVESELIGVAAKRQRGGRVATLVVGTPFRGRLDDVAGVDTDVRPPRRTPRRIARLPGP